MAFLFVGTFSVCQPLQSFSLKQSNLLLLYGYLYSMSCPHLSPIITVCPLWHCPGRLQSGFGIFLVPICGQNECIMPWPRCCELIKIWQLIKRNHSHEEAFTQWPFKLRIADNCTLHFACSPVLTSSHWNQVTKDSGRDPQKNDKRMSQITSPVTQRAAEGHLKKARLIEKILNYEIGNIPFFLLIFNCLKIVCRTSWTFSHLKIIFNILFKYLNIFPSCAQCRQ